MTKVKQIRRINVKGKFYVYQFDNKGRIVTRVKWNNKDNSLRKSIGRFKQSNSIKQGQQRTKLTNFYEVVQEKKFDFRSPNQNRPNRQYQYFVKIKVGRDIISARSMKHEEGFPVDEARGEAIRNAVGRISDYQEDVEPSRVKILNEGFVHYAKV